MNTPETLGKPKRTRGTSRSPQGAKKPRRKVIRPITTWKDHEEFRKRVANVARDITIATVIAQKICHEQGWSALEEIAEAINKPDTAKTPEIARAAQLQRELRELFKEGVRLNLDSHQ